MGSIDVVSGAVGSTDAAAGSRAAGSGDRVRVSARLLATRDETPYWSEIVDVEAGEIFEVQDAAFVELVPFWMLFRVGKFFSFW